jgi:hypothetical protein
LSLQVAAVSDLVMVFDFCRSSCAYDCLLLLPSSVI